MDASSPLLPGEREAPRRPETRRQAQRKAKRPSAKRSGKPRASSAQYAYIEDGGGGAYDRADSDDGGSVCCCWRRRQGAGGDDWACWKWILPERIADYDDFATTAQMGEIYFVRQKAREFFEPNAPDDEDMVRHLWNGLFPTLPYEGRVNSRWRDVGFQNDDPASDLRSSGRLALKMMLFFADHLNDEFKRMVRDNRFPVCLCAINLLEVIMTHLKLKDPPPLVCPCCGTENAERETAQPNRARPELRGFARMIDDAAESVQSSGQLVFSAWAVELALAQVFMHSMLVLDAVWARQLRRDPTITLMHFRGALLDTRERLVAFLSRRNTPLTLVELHAWSFRQRAKLKAARPNI